MLDSTIAERVYRLGQVVDVTDPHSRTLRECLASKGLDSDRLIKAANLWGKSLIDTPWPEGMTIKDYRKMRRDAGNTSKREYNYARIKKDRSICFYRTAYEQDLRDTMDFGDVLIKAGKMVWGLRAEGGKLFRPDGSEADVIHFVPKEA